MLVGIACPESNFPNPVSPHVLSRQTCFSGLSQKVNHLEHRRGGRRQGPKEKIVRVKVLLEASMPLPPGQQTFGWLTVQPWVTAEGPWPTATRSFQGVTQFPLMQVDGVRSRGEEGPMAGGCEASGPDGASNSRWIPSPLDSAVTVHSSAQHWKESGISNLVIPFLHPESPTWAFSVPIGRKVAPHTTGAHAPSIQQHWRRSPVSTLLLAAFQ